MDKMMYIITNSGSIEYICDTAEERQKKWVELQEAESHYQCTHYYYGTLTMTRGEYVCDRLCKYVETAINNAKFVAERDGVDWKEKFKWQMEHVTCRDCPFKKYSPYTKENENG